MPGHMLPARSLDASSALPSAPARHCNGQKAQNPRVRYGNGAAHGTAMVLVLWGEWLGLGLPHHLQKHAAGVQQ